MSVEEWIRNSEQRGHVTFSVAELHEAFAGRSLKGLNTELGRLVTRGRIISVYRGYYVIVPVQYQLKRVVPPSFYIEGLMRYVGKPYYVCLLSAAALHGAAHQRSMQYQVMTVVPRLNTSSLNPLLDWSYRTQIPSELILTKNAEMDILRYSNPELTAIDLVQFADHIGGYQRAATVLAELVESVDISKMELVFPYTTAATVQRLGYLLEFVLEEQDMADQLHILLKKHFPRRHSFCMSNAHARRENNQTNRWNINMNIDIEIDEL